MWKILLALPLAIVGWFRDDVPEQEVRDRPEVAASYELDAPCLGDRGCVDERLVFVDFDALGVPGRDGGRWVAYDWDEVTRKLDAPALDGESELSLAVRLVISEVGADRILENQNGLLEAVGILYTVDNRLDPAVYNPDGRPEAPAFPGCGLEGTYAGCTNAKEYLGMATWRALDPRRGYDPDLLADAVDLAVSAWWLQDNGLMADPTGGATSYVHRCGGAAYGLTTPHCDGHVGNSGVDDVAGANPATGPIVFKGPTAFLPSRGYYAITEIAVLDYVPWSAQDEGDALAALD